jgi:hypothetical protein
MGEVTATKRLRVNWTAEERIDWVRMFENSGKPVSAFCRENDHQNPIEDNIRPTKIGAKNWMHIGHPKAGWRSAVMYSVMGTCRLVGVDPFAYHEWVLPKLAAAKSQNTGGLLPHEFARVRSLDSS